MIILHSYEHSRGALLGDTICGIPAVTQLAQIAKSKGEAVYYDCPNKAVAELMPKALELKSLYDCENLSSHKVHRISIHDLFAAHQHNFHPTVGLCVMQGLTQGGVDPIRPVIEYEKKDVESYDLIFSPYSRANGVRMMPIYQWQQLLAKLPDLKIGVIGAGEEPQEFDSVDYLFGKPIHEVCSYLEAAKLVVTIDNGIGRLMQAIGGKHLLLCSNAVRYNWGTYPDAHVIFDHPKNFNINDRVYNMIRSLLL